jgi:hypothetical protein
MSSFKIERHGAVMASVRLTHLWSSAYGISLNVSSDEATIDDCRVILLQSITKTRSFGALRLDFQLSTSTPLHESLAQPLVWRSALELAHNRNQIAAVSVGQVDRVSGWSRISYIGIVPAFRGRGLGIWVQRHGFDLMRRQQGTLHHGGTSAENHRIIRIFETHECEFYRRLQEWRLPLESGGVQ